MSERIRVEDWASTFTWPCYECGEAAVTYDSTEDYERNEEDENLVSCPACGAQYAIAQEVLYAYFLQEETDEQRNSRVLSFPVPEEGE
jgi:hypothetical protein